MSLINPIHCLVYKLIIRFVSSVINSISYQQGVIHYSCHQQQWSIYQWVSTEMNINFIGMKHSHCPSLCLKTLWMTDSFFKKLSILTSFCFIFVLFTQNSNINWKKLWIRRLGHRMVGADWSTELWWPSMIDSFDDNKQPQSIAHLYLHCPKMCQPQPLFCLFWVFSNK